ncbi:MAG: GTPase HflX [Bdellovibrionales bacterium]|nr:GTPase HflX [Bdellovibrionales bacterium]
MQMQAKTQDKAVVVGVGLKTDSFVELKDSLAELEELVYAAGGEVVGTVAQTLHQYNPATLLGSGKVNEIRELVENSGASLVVIDHHLSGVQGRNLEKEIGVKVLDRTQLILDIFAQRAKTYEGKLQVELAQMLDQLPRMVGAWQGSLSRQAGGIGTRGPGETALEIDRRRIHSRIKVLKKKLGTVTKNRAQYRAARQRSEIPSFALIGYTNSGKSTLLNQLCNARVLTKDQPFATLDPATRKVFLPEVKNAVVTDTVGFIRRLPTELIEAFKATLEESVDADVLIHVVDLSSDQMQSQMQTVHNLIKEFGWHSKPIIHAFNKVDKAPFERQFQVKEHPRVFLSALTGEGVEKLRNQMVEQVRSLHKEAELFFPKAEEYLIYELGRETSINRTEPNSVGTVCFANLTPDQLHRWQNFLVKKEASSGKTPPPEPVPESADEE